MRDSARLRKLDKYLGIPICFFFSLLNKMRSKKKEADIKNILVIELFEMGASLMTYSSLKYICNRLENPNIYCLTTLEMIDSWEIMGIIPKERIIAVDGSSLVSFLVSMTKAVWELRNKQLDMIIDFELFMRVSAVISFLIRADYRAGFYRYEFEGLYRGTFYDFKCSYNQNSHIAKNYLALTKTALNLFDEYPNFKGNVSSMELELPIYVSRQKHKVSIEAKIKDIFQGYDKSRTKLIIISADVGPNLSMRNYPQDFFVEVIDNLLLQYADALILLIGTRENRLISKYIQDKVNDERCVDFCGMTSFYELFELLGITELLISNDNGPAHFASATNTKTLALFSTDSPFIYGPLGKCVIAYSFYHCSPCITAYNHKNSNCKNNLCLQALPPSKVLELACAILEDKVTYRTVNNQISYL